MSDPSLRFRTGLRIGRETLRVNSWANVSIACQQVLPVLVPNPPPGFTRVCPYLLYEDAARAVEYLTNAFGFVQRSSRTGAAGRLHTELVLGDDGLVMLGQAGESFQSPKTLDVQPSVLIHLYVDDVEALHERAKAAGADVSELETSPANDRRFAATDPEGQVWYFAQRIDS